MKMNNSRDNDNNTQDSPVRKAIMAEDVREGEGMVKGLVEFENAAEEWSNITEVTAKFQDDEEDKEAISVPPVTPLVTVDIVVEHLRNLEEMESLLGQVKIKYWSQIGLKRLFDLNTGPRLVQRGRMT